MIVSRCNVREGVVPDLALQRNLVLGHRAHERDRQGQQLQCTSHLRSADTVV